ncbi:hypothetical protein NY547_09205 [Cnuibacter physcomitrellae]|nr:hypothetical protein [Cnuibacter physcomitrellae]
MTGILYLLGFVVFVTGFAFLWIGEDWADQMGELLAVLAWPLLVVAGAIDLAVGRERRSTEGQ